MFIWLYDRNTYIYIKVLDLFHVNYKYLSKSTLCIGSETTIFLFFYICRSINFVRLIFFFQFFFDWALFELALWEIIYLPSKKNYKVYVHSILFISHLWYYNKYIIFVDLSWYVLLRNSLYVYVFLQQKI